MSMPRFRFVAALVAVLALSLVGNGGAATATRAAPKPSPTRGVVIVDADLAYEGARSEGTGIVLTSTGEVLTNNHVIRGATRITVTVPASRRTYSASVVGYSVVYDIALLKLNGASKLATHNGTATRLRVGQTTTAVGNANGAGRLVVSTGRITGLNQAVAVADDMGGTVRMTGLIGTSATLVPGDSGGALLDATGRVIGVNAVGTSSSATGRSAGGYAIPIGTAMGIVKLVRAGTSTSAVHVGPTPFLGVTLARTSAGLAVGQVVDGGPAATAGIEQGSVLTTLDGEQLGSIDVLRAALFTRHPGDTVEIGYLDPRGNAATTTVVLGDGPPQ